MRRWQRARPIPGLGVSTGARKITLGQPKAVTATGHKIACVVYHMLKYHEEFIPLDVTIYELRARERRMRNLRKQAEDLGYELVERQVVA
jgi:hypothetical protein